MSESHGSISQDYQSDTSTSENNRLFSFEQSPTLFCPSTLVGEQKHSIHENGITRAPHMNIVELQYEGSSVKVKQEMVLEDSSVFLACDDKPCLLGLNRENEADSSDSGNNQIFYLQFNANLIMNEKIHINLLHFSSEWTEYEYTERLLYLII